MVLPFAISGFWNRTWSHGRPLCLLVPFLRYGNVGVSLLSIALITLNRYVSWGYIVYLVTLHEYCMVLKRVGNRPQISKYDSECTVITNLWMITIFVSNRDTIYPGLVKQGLSESENMSFNGFAAFRALYP